MAENIQANILSRNLTGKEKNACSKLPTGEGRFTIFWNTLTQNFTAIMGVNIFMLIFFAPIVGFFIYKTGLVAIDGATMPFGAFIGFGYPNVSETVGLAESINLKTNLLFYGLTVACSVLASLGLSGGIYAFRNAVWGKTQIKMLDFWKGLVKNYLPALFAGLLFSLVLFGATYVIYSARYFMAIYTDNHFWYITMQVVAYVFIALTAVIALWILNLGANYKLGFFSLLANSLYLTFKSILANIVMLVCAFAPLAVLFITSSSWSFITYLVLMLVGIAWPLLVWTIYSEWTFDNMVGVTYSVSTNSKTKEEIAEDEKALIEYKKQILLNKSLISARPVKAIDDGIEVYSLGEIFNLKDLQKLDDSKKAVEQDSEKYIEEHKFDKKYVDYNTRYKKLREELTPKDNGKKKKEKTLPLKNR